MAENSRKRCIEVMETYIEEIVAKGNTNLLREISAEDVIDETAVEAGLGSGIAGLEKHVKYFRKAVSDLKVTLDQVVASDDAVVGIWTVKGKHSAPLFDIKATGRDISWTNVSIFRLEDGMLAHYRGVWGALEAVKQMGVPISLPEQT